MRPLLEVIGISKQFGGLAALKKVSFQVAERSIFGLIGPNGAGKTTLFNVVAGAMRPTGGEVRLNGKNLTGKRSFRMVKEGVSRTHQIVAPFRSMTVLENVLVGVHFGRAPPTSRRCFCATKSAAGSPIPRPPRSSACCGKSGKRAPR